MLMRQGHLQLRCCHQKMLKTMSPVCPLQKQSRVTPQGTVKEGIIGASQRKWGGYGNFSMFYLGIKYHEKTSNPIESCQEELSFQIFDFPSGDYAQTNYINLNRLLGNNDDYFVKKLTLVQQFIQSYRPFVRQVLNAPLHIRIATKAVHQEYQGQT